MEDSSGQSLLFQFILLLILTLLTAFFSASEMALVSLNHAEILYFYAPALVSSEWHESQTYVCTIGGHRFFGEAGE